MSALMTIRAGMATITFEPAWVTVDADEQSIEFGLDAERCSDTYHRVAKKLSFVAFRMDVSRVHAVEAGPMTGLMTGTATVVIGHLVYLMVFGAVDTGDTTISITETTKSWVLRGSVSGPHQGQFTDLGALTRKAVLDSRIEMPQADTASLLAAVEWRAAEAHAAARAALDLQKRIAVAEAEIERLRARVEPGVADVADVTGEAILRWALATNEWVEVPGKREHVRHANHVNDVDGFTIGVGDANNWVDGPRGRVVTLSTLAKVHGKSAWAILAEVKGGTHPLTPRERLARLDHDAILDMINRGPWVRVTDPRVPYPLYRHAAYGLRQLLVPTDKGDPGYLDGIEVAVRRIADVEQRSLESVLAELEADNG